MTSPNQNQVIQHEARKQLAKSNLLSYTTFCNPKYTPHWYHQVIAETLDKWVRHEIRNLIIVMPPRHGKALTLDTPIPTPDRGFVPMGDLVAGDKVFGRDGKPCNVVARSEVWKDRVVYRVDGTSIVADECHEWEVETCRKRKSRAIRETRTLADSGKAWRVRKAPNFVIEGLTPTPLDYFSLRFTKLDERADTVCIEVDGPDHLFLAGYECIPTRNTELASRNLPAYILGRAPTKLIIAAAATQELAEANSRDVKRIMQSPQHVELFGDMLSDKKLVKDTEKVWQLAEGGTYNATGTGNNIAGRGADYIIVDDYINNREAAESPTQRDKAWSWFLDDILTRRHYPGSTLVMATRWHFDDIIGRIEQGENNEDWVILHLPKMLEGKPGPFDKRTREGEMLLSPFTIAPWEHLKGTPPPPYDPFLQREAQEVSYQELQKRERDAFLGRRSKNSYGVDALEQGNPVPKEGGLFKASWIKRYTAAPHVIAEAADYLLISIDAAMKDTKTSDNCSIVVLARVGPLIFVLEEDTDKMDYPLLKQRAKIMAAKYPSATIVIEDKANGIALVAELRKLLPRVIPFDPGPYGNKVSRAQMAADRYEGGSLLHPLEMHAPWISNFEAELTGFPFRKRDDRVDAVSQAVLFMDNKKGASERLNTAMAGIQSLLASF